jgi:signal transduction histidine kinase
LTRPGNEGQPPRVETEEVTALEAPRDHLDELRREIADVRASRERLALAGDDERRNLERVLHDGLQQQLVGLAANVELAAASLEADPATTTALLAAIRDDLRRALEGTRALAQQIYPPLLEAGGLGPAVREAASRADVTVTIEGASGQILPPEIAGAIYFCFADVIEWAGAGASATISLRNDDETVSFEIGVDRELGAEWPLTSRDRVEALGGSLHVDRTRLAGRLPSSR